MVRVAVQVSRSCYTHFKNYTPTYQGDHVFHNVISIIKFYKISLKQNWQVLYNKHPLTMLEFLLQHSNPLSLHLYKVEESESRTRVDPFQD